MLKSDLVRMNGSSVACVHLSHFMRLSVCDVTRARSFANTRLPLAPHSQQDIVNKRARALISYTLIVCA